MAWPKLRKSRSRAPLVPFSNRGEAPAPEPGGSGSGESVRLIWPSGNPVGAAAAEPADPAGAAADPDDLPIWDWGPDQSELDDPSDAFAPDRPEYPDGPGYPDDRDDRDDRWAAGAEPPPLVVPASAWTDGTRRDGESRQSGRSGRPGQSGPSGQDRGLRRPSAPVVSTMAAQADEQREGIGQHLGSIAHLSADPMKRAWVWRTVIAIAIAVVVSIFVNWQLGLSLAVLVVIADTIFRARWAGRMGPEGARQTAAQLRTRRQLAKLKRAGYRCVHDGAIAGSDDLIDHLVVGPAGVFSIDSEAWDRRLPVRTTKGKLWHGPFSMRDRIEHARWESERAAAQLSSALGTRVTVRPAMAVYGPKIPWDVVTISGVDVFSGPKLRRYLRHVARQSGTRLLSDSEIERMESAAQTAFPQADTR